MDNVLVCWLGNTDLKAAQGDLAAGLGPIGRAVAARPFDAIHLLSDYPASRSAPTPPGSGSRLPPRCGCAPRPPPEPGQEVQYRWGSLPAGS